MMIQAKQTDIKDENIEKGYLGITKNINNQL